MNKSPKLLRIIAGVLLVLQVPAALFYRTMVIGAVYLVSSENGGSQVLLNALALVFCFLPLIISIILLVVANKISKKGK